MILEPGAAVPYHPPLVMRRPKQDWVLITAETTITISRTFWQPQYFGFQNYFQVNIITLDSLSEILGFLLRNYWWYVDTVAGHFYEARSNSKHVLSKHTKRNRNEYRRISIPNIVIKIVVFLLTKVGYVQTLSRKGLITFVDVRVPSIIFCETLPSEWFHFILSCFWFFLKIFGILWIHFAKRTAEKLQVIKYLISRLPESSGDSSSSVSCNANVILLIALHLPAADDMQLWSLTLRSFIWVFLYLPLYPMEHSFILLTTSGAFLSTFTNITRIFPTTPFKNKFYESYLLEKGNHFESIFLLLIRQYKFNYPPS